jgi:hypothetical protein
MKKIFKIIPFLLLAAQLCPINGMSHGINKNYNSDIKPDTLIPGGYIRVDTFDLSIIPPASGVQFYKDGILFLSSSKLGNHMLSEHISFGKTDGMFAVVKDNKTENPKVFSPSGKFPYPAEAVTFTKDFKTMYFTKYSVADGVEKIFKATFSAEGEQGKWVIDEKPLSFCTGKAAYTHPALSADGKMMIFSSNQTGSLGGMDLFITQLEGSGWSEPKNLGDAINTRLNEMYPFLDAGNNLYYSSDGLLGYGGYDIFVCKFRINTWESPVNISAPVNSLYDDVAFTMDKTDGKSAFYTLKEKSGKRSVRLIKITLSNSGPDKMLTLSQFFTNPASRNIVMIVSEPAVEATDRKVATVEKPKGKDDNIIYRVQILTSFNPKTRQLINLEGKDYSIYEYLYSGAYRLCVGEFSSIAPAIELRNKFIQNDYSQATVVVFRNNVRSFDPDLLEEPVVSATLAKNEKPKTEGAAPVLNTREEPKKEVPVTEATKTEPAKQAVKETVTAKNEPAKPATTVPETKKAEPAKVPGQVTQEKKDVVVYRVQIITNTASKGSYKININNKTYDTFEYNYAGAYRTCVGEFATLGPAKELQNSVRQHGYPQAFVVAFKNNVRSTDPALFK